MKIGSKAPEINFKGTAPAIAFAGRDGIAA